MAFTSVIMPVIQSMYGKGGRGIELEFPAMALCCTAVSSEAWAKLRDWASVAGMGRLLLSGSVAHASLKTAVPGDGNKREPEID